MRVAVVTVDVPFVRGGAEILVDALTSRLRKSGIEAEQVALPFSWHRPDTVADQILSARLWSLEGVDKVIGLKFPAYLIPHDDKVLWVLHQHRLAYDLWDDPVTGRTPEGAANRAMRRVVQAADDRWLREARETYAISQVTADRLLRYNGVGAQVLWPPLADPASFRSGAYGGYVLCLSRLATPKRQELLVKAMSYVRTDAHLVLAGAPDEPTRLERVRQIVARRGLRNRVTVLGRWVHEHEKIALMAEAGAVAFVPFDEDYGFVSLEAAAAARPIITCTDSGGANTFVRDEETGLICSPDPRSIAAAIDRLIGDRQLAARLGRNARDHFDSLALDWDVVIGTLLG